jgi:hypothetical protein
MRLSPHLVVALLGPAPPAHLAAALSGATCPVGFMAGRCWRSRLSGLPAQATLPRVAPPAAFAAGRCWWPHQPRSLSQAKGIDTDQPRVRVLRDVAEMSEGRELAPGTVDG